MDSQVPHKIVVMLKATGGAPVLKQSKFKISSTERFQVVVDFLRKQLRKSTGEQLFIYLNSSFAPTPDENLSDLYKGFAVDNKLILQYALTPAWG